MNITGCTKKTVNNKIQTNCDLNKMHKIKQRIKLEMQIKLENPQGINFYDCNRRKADGLTET